jgi:hypothetical protein
LIMKKQKILDHLCSGLGVLVILTACQTKIQKSELSFQSRLIMDSVTYLWAHCPADVTNDNITDLVFIHNNARGGYLGYFKGKKDPGTWQEHIIAETPPDGGLFAMGDMECADIDFDGDVDVLAAKHPGEWEDAGEPSIIYWYENPGWRVHPVGQVPDAIKDVSLADFDNDRKMDLAVLTYDSNTLSVFQQHDADQWEMVQSYLGYNNLHEGMGTGDVDGDGWTDIVANAYIFYNPGGDLTAVWKVENLDEKWNSQTGDWSRNGTKTYLRDIDGDGRAEIFIGHSERSGYPLSCYRKDNHGEWHEIIIMDSIPACHTLQVFDFDGDGDQDVLAGINASRAVNLGAENFEIYIFLLEELYHSWKPFLLGDEGIYNGQAADYDQDGDDDIFRYPSHDSTRFYLLENRIIE